MNQIKRILEERHLSEKDLMRITGISLKYIIDQNDAKNLKSSELNTLSETLGVPIFALLQGKINKVKELPKDYRTEGNRSVLQTKQSLSAIYKAYNSASFLDAIPSQISNKEKNLPKLHFGKSSVQNVVSKIQNFLEIDESDIVNYENPINAFTHIRYSIEKSGIFVFSERVQDYTVKGFCLQSKNNNYIVINSLKSSYRSRIFTIVHELAHLFLGEPGIVDTITTRLPLEKFCNQVAANFLLSENRLDSLLSELPKAAIGNPSALVDALQLSLPYSKYFIAMRVAEVGAPSRNFVSRWLSEVGLRQFHSNRSHEEIEGDSLAVDRLDEEEHEGPQIRRTTPASYHSARLGFRALSLLHVAKQENAISIFDSQYGLDLPAKSFEKTYESYLRRIKEVRKNAPE